MREARTFPSYGGFDHPLCLWPLEKIKGKRGYRGVSDTILADLSFVGSDESLQLGAWIDAPPDRLEPDARAFHDQVRRLRTTAQSISILEAFDREHPTGMSLVAEGCMLLSLFKGVLLVKGATPSEAMRQVVAKTVELWEWREAVDLLNAFANRMRN